MVGDVGVGSDHPIAVQSMCTTKTHDVDSTLQQIAELTASGCDIVRVACPRQEDADALAEIARHSQIPVIADIHFQPRYIFAAIDAGCAAVRVNPGNYADKKKFAVREYSDSAYDRASIEAAQRLRVRIDDPCGGGADAAEHYHEARSVAIHQQPFYGREPGVEQDHDAERQLNAGPLPVVLFLHRIDEQGPAILQVGNHHHADDAENQLAPAGGI
jgi:hypothetical protein